MSVKVSCGDIICVLNHCFNHVMLVSGEPFYMHGRDWGEEQLGPVTFIPTLEISSEEALEEGEVVEDGEIDEARRGPLLSLDGSLFRQPV